MPQANVVMNVRKINNTVSIIDIEGDVSAFAEDISDGSIRGSQLSNDSHNHFEFQWP